MRSRAVRLPLACWRAAARSSASRSMRAMRWRKAVVATESAMVVPWAGVSAGAPGPVMGAVVTVQASSELFSGVFIRTRTSPAETVRPALTGISEMVPSLGAWT